MQHWTDDERRAARKLGIPTGDRVWWWRAQHVLNSTERDQLVAFTAWVTRRYASDVTALRRRTSMHAV